MEMAAAEMLYSGKNRTKRDDMMFVNVELLNVIVHITLEWIELKRFHCVITLVRPQILMWEMIQLGKKQGLNPPFNVFFWFINTKKSTSG